MYQANGLLIRKAILWHLHSAMARFNFNICKILVRDHTIVTMKYLSVGTKNANWFICKIFLCLLVPPEFHAMQCITERVKYHYTVLQKNFVLIHDKTPVTCAELAL